MSKIEACIPPEEKGPVWKDNAFDRIVVAIMMICGCFVVLAVAGGAIMRYLFRKDIYGIEELTTIAAFWMYFAGAVYATKTRKQISAEMFSMITKNPVALYVSVLLQRAVTLALCLIYSWWGFEFLHWSVTDGGKTNLWQIPIFVGQAAVFFGLIGMLAYFLRDLVMILRTKPSAYRHGDA